MKIYVAHAYRGNARANRAVCRRIAKHIWQGCNTPVAVQLIYHQFADERAERKRIMAACIDHLLECDELWWYGKRMTDGMKEEIQRARGVGIPVRHKPTPREVSWTRRKRRRW